MAKHFRKNHRLRWVFRLCQKLGIDDPCHWMNSVSPAVVDQWIGFMIAEREDKQENEKMDPQEALKKLTGGE